LKTLGQLTGKWVSLPSRYTTWQREELLQLLTLSVILAGLCITCVTLFHTATHPTWSETSGDDALAISALLFLLCTYFTFFALRVKVHQFGHFLEQAADLSFLQALTSMVGSGFIMVYIIWQAHLL
jgi:hypothetical protein